MPGLAGPDPARPLGDGAHFAALARIQRQDTVSLTPISMPQDHSFHTEGTRFRQEKIIALKYRKNSAQP